MRMVLGIATALGLIGVVAAFGLFYLAERVFHLDRAHIQTLMYLKLSVAGHLTIFLTRTRGPFWSIRPARILWGAVLATQTVATLIAVYGLLMTPLGWKWAGFVWIYAIAWFLVNDQVKWLAYRIFDPVKKPKPEAKVEPKKPEAKTETKEGAMPKDNTKPKPDATPDAKPDSKPDAKPGAKPDATPDATPDAKPDDQPDTKEMPTPEDSKPVAKPVGVVNKETTSGQNFIHVHRTKDALDIYISDTDSDDGASEQKDKPEPKEKK
jgi:H+-transporting ATPase